VTAIKQEQWQNEQQWEAEWWGDCADTSEEEFKQREYAGAMGLEAEYGKKTPCAQWYDLGGKSVLDIGGGPVSLLLKCRNRGRCVVADPAAYPSWVKERYDAAGIEYLKIAGEDFPPRDERNEFDEVWIYNVLQHVRDPAAVIERAKQCGRKVRVFEWLEVPACKGHPHVLTAELLDGALGTRGEKVKVPWWDAGNGYAATVEVKPRPAAPARPEDPAARRFHLLGLAHIPTNSEVTCCAFTQKIRKLARMLRSLGHYVMFYGAEHSDVECDEFVQVISDAERVACVGDYDWRQEFFKFDSGDEAHATFNRNAITQIRARSTPEDFILATMGTAHKPVTDAVGLERTIESGIGYSGIYAKYKVFESYAWMHHLYGVRGVNDGAWYDCVIPNYFDVDEFPLGKQDGDYYLFMGRLIRRKGLDVAVQVTRALGKRLIVAGQGSLTGGDLNITDSHVTHVGAVGAEKRAELMGGAIAMFAPTYYIEPFGGVAVECMLCGTPVITTDWGAFPETVRHGVTGFRCRTFDDFCYAAQEAGSLRRLEIRRWAERNYSLKRVARMYDEYFAKIADIGGAGWYTRHPERKELDWLRKYGVER